MTVKIRVLLSCEAVWCCSRIPVFQRRGLERDGRFSFLLASHNRTPLHSMPICMPFYPIQVTSSWRWRQHVPLICCYPTTTLHGVTTQKTSTWTCQL